MAITISVLALIATFYQLHLQRVHNEKSLKPLGQIRLDDRSHTISIRLYNNGLGPLIVERLIFIRNDSVFSSIKDCLDLDPKLYDHISMDDLLERVILPNAHLTIFEKDLENCTEAEADQIRKQLAMINLEAECHDIYENKTSINRSFRWFSRHIEDNR